MVRPSGWASPILRCGARLARLAGLAAFRRAAVLLAVRGPARLEADLRLDQRVRAVTPQRGYRRYLQLGVQLRPGAVFGAGGGAGDRSGPRRGRGGVRGAALPGRAGACGTREEIHGTE